MKQFTLNPYQRDLINKIKNLPQHNLHYLTVQQSIEHPNLTINEFRKLIKSGIRNYYQGLNYLYKQGDEKKALKYVAIFETTKNFNLSIKNPNPITATIPYMGLHCHLFISHLRGHGLIDYNTLIHQIFCSLTSLKHKVRCIKKYDYLKPEVLEDRFIQYHVKQQIVPSKMVLYNV